MTSERAIFLSGRKTDLRPISKEDVPKLLIWVNDPEVRQFVSNFFPTTQVSEEEWVSNIGKNKNNIVLGIENKEGKLIGTMGLHNINWVSRSATTGTLIGDKEFWGNGFGSDAKMTLLDYAFNTLNFHRVSSDAYAFNERSIRYSLRCGYRIEGRRREAHFWGGQYWDIVELGVLREEWLPLWQKYQKTGSLKD